MNVLCAVGVHRYTHIVMIKHYVYWIQSGIIFTPEYRLVCRCGATKEVDEADVLAHRHGVPVVLPKDPAEENQNDSNQEPRQQWRPEDYQTYTQKCGDIASATASGLFGLW